MWDKHTGESSRGGILGTSNRSLHTHSETSSTVSAGTQKYMISSKEAGTVYYFSCVLQINTLSSPIIIIIFTIVLIHIQKNQKHTVYTYIPVVKLLSHSLRM